MSLYTDLCFVHAKINVTFSNVLDNTIFRYLYLQNICKRMLIAISYVITPIWKLKYLLRVEYINKSLYTH